MNTGIRRFILRVAVGLLAFLLGVAVVWALGGINPFQGSSGSYRKRCGQQRSWSSSSGGSHHVTKTETFTHYDSGRSCRMKRMFSAVPPPPPAAPVAPAD